MNKNKKEKIKNKRGFTLVELMIASLLGGIVLSACGMLLVGQWRAHSDFINKEVTMNEIKLLTTAFRNEVRAKGNASDLVLYDYVELTDSAGKVSSFKYDDAKNSIIYTYANGTTFEMLEKSVVNGFEVRPVTNTSALKMIIRIEETEFGNQDTGDGTKENDYTIYVTTR